MEQLQKLQYLSLVSKVTSGADASAGIEQQRVLCCQRGWEACLRNHLSNPQHRAALPRAGLAHALWPPACPCLPDCQVSQTLP